MATTSCNVITRIKLSGKRLPEENFFSAASTYYRNIIAENDDKNPDCRKLKSMMIPSMYPRQMGGGHVLGCDKPGSVSKKHSRKFDEKISSIWSALENISSSVDNFIAVFNFYYNQQLRDFLSKFNIHLNTEGDYSADFLILNIDKGIFIVKFNIDETASSVDHSDYLIDGLKEMLKMFQILQVPIRIIEAFPKSLAKDHICFDQLAIEDPIKWWKDIPNAPFDDDTNNFETVVSLIVALRCRWEAIDMGKNCELIEIEQVPTLNDQPMATKAVILKLVKPSEKDIQNILGEYDIMEKPLVLDVFVAKIVELVAKRKKIESQTKEMKLTKIEKQIRSISCIIGEQYYILNPSQLGILEGGPRQIIEGPPGSGKSQSLLYKVYELCEKNEKTCIIAPKLMAHKYEEFFFEKLAIVNIYDDNNFYELCNVKTDFVKSLADYHLFFDDFFNVNTMLEIEEIEEILQTLMKDRDGKFYFWIVCDSHQINVDDVTREMELKILNLTKEQNFQHQILRYVMRCTSNLFQHYEQWEPIEGNKPLICIGNCEVIPNNQSLTLQISGEKIINRTIYVETNDHLIEHLVARINKIKNIYPPSEIAIIDICGKNSKLDEKTICEIESKTELKIVSSQSAGSRSMENLQMVKLVPDQSIHSLQWHCVIVVMDAEETKPELKNRKINQLQYIAYTRAMYALYCITIRPLLK